MRSLLLAPLLLISALSAVAQLPAFSHVFIVVEENHDYSSVIGAGAMPYLNSLASKYGLATQYYADAHPSIGNYFMLTTGAVITNNDNFDSTVTADNVVRHLIAAGKTWKSYEESLPSVGYISPDTTYYVRRHCPLSYFSDVVNSGQRNNLVPFSQFAKDLSGNALPQYSFITPNLCHDAHNCSLSAADAWLKDNIGPLLASSTFKNGGLLIITFDESANDNTRGGGRIAWVAISPEFSKPGYRSTTAYQHQNTLRLMLQALGVKTYPGAAANTNNMAEFFE